MYCLPITSSLRDDRSCTFLWNFSFFILSDAGGIDDDDDDDDSDIFNHDDVDDTNFLLYTFDDDLIYLKAL